MKRDARVFLRDILDSIRRIEEYTRGFDEARFLKEGPPKMRSCAAWKSSGRR
jgi:uncharacterized protein with HEPN domain